HHLEHARRQLVALLQAPDLLLEDGLDETRLLFRCGQDALDARLLGRVLDADVAPLAARNLAQDGLADLAARLEPGVLAPLVGHAHARALAEHQVAPAVQRRLTHDADLVLLIEPQLGDLAVGDRAAAVVLVGATAAEHAGTDHDARLTRRDAQGSVSHVAGLLAED